jgi:hypothetical protein
MTKLKIKSPVSPILLIALAVAVVAGYLSYWNNLQQKTVVADTMVQEVKSDFTFKASKAGGNSFVEIYKQDKLIQTVMVKSGTVDAASFKVAPNDSSVSFTVTTGKTKMQGMIDLKTFKYTAK